MSMSRSSDASLDPPPAAAPPESPAPEVTRRHADGHRRRDGKQHERGDIGRFRRDAAKQAARNRSVRFPGAERLRADLAVYGVAV